MACLACFACMVVAQPGQKIPGTNYKYNGHPYRLTHPPAGKGPFPLVAFFHALGTSGWAINGYSELIRVVNEAGYTVVTGFDRPVIQHKDAIKWIQDTIEGAKAQTITGVTDKTDWNRVGIMGHSMGGGTVLHGMADAPGSLNIKVGVALHPWMFVAPDPEPAQAKGPIMYTTGSKDTAVPHMPAKVRAAFEKAPHPKVFANLHGATHMEPLNSPLGKHRWNPYVASFFDCHLKADEAACTKVYKDMGQDSNLPLDEFISDKNGTVPPSPAPPVPPEPPTPCNVKAMCYSAMKISQPQCKEGGGASCVACLGLKTPILLASGCPVSPIAAGKAMHCFCGAGANISIIV